MCGVMLTLHWLNAMKVGMLHFSWELLFSFKGFGLSRLSQHFIVLEKVVLSSIQPLQFLRSGATHNVVRKGVPGF